MIDVVTAAGHGGSTATTGNRDKRFWQANYHAAFAMHKSNFVRSKEQ
jgi:hypothetical protein